MPGDKGFEIGDFPHPESLQWDEENTNRKDVQPPIENSITTDSVLTDSGCSGSSITHTVGPAGHKKKVIGGIILVIGTALAIAVGVSMGRGTTTDTVSAANIANTHDHGRHSKSQKSKGIDFVVSANMLCAKCVSYCFPLPDHRVLRRSRLTSNQTNQDRASLAKSNVLILITAASLSKSRIRSKVFVNRLVKYWQQEAISLTP